MNPRNSIVNNLPYLAILTGTFFDKFGQCSVNLNVKKGAVKLNG